MGRSATARIRLNGKTYNTPSRYFIPQYLHDEYCNSSVVIQDSEGLVEVFASTGCPGCGREYTEATRPTKMCCNNSDVNHAFGYVLVICIDCYWYLQKQKGMKIPESIDKKIEQGFKPRKIEVYL